MTTENRHARRQADRHAEIIAGARQVFFDKGFSRTSMDDVLQVIGGSKRTLYQHFASKEDLFSAVIASVSDQAFSPLEQRATGDLEQTLTELGVRYVSMLVSREGLAVYRAMIAEAPHLPDLAEAFFTKGPKRLSDMLTGIFETHNGSGGRPVAHPRAAAEQFIGMIRGNLHLAALVRNKIPSQPQIALMVRESVQTLMLGVEAPHGR